MTRDVWNRLAIGRKFSLLLAASAVAFMGAGAVLFFLEELPRMKRQEAIGLAGTADVVADSLSVAVSLRDTRGIEAALQAFRAMPAVESAAVYGIDGKSIGAYLSGAGRRAPESSEPGISIVGASVSVTRPVGTGQDVEAFLVVRAQLVEAANLEKHFVGVLAIVGLIAIIGAVMLGWLTNRWILRPLYGLEKTAARVCESKDYSLRTDVDREDEVGQLMRAFNEMLEQIQARDAELEQHRATLEEKVAERTGELVIAKNKAESAARMKSEFLANMSHEIRTPLNGVLGMLQLAMMVEMSEEQREYLQTCRYSAEALLQLLNDILDFSRIEAGRMELEREPFGVRKLLEETLRQMAAKADEKGLAIHLFVDPGVGRQAIGDALRIRQIVLNLVGNAIKFTEQGEVSVHASRPENGMLQLSVRDTGIGIPAGRLEAIMEPFSQADGSTTRRYGGTGLGLTITKNLVNLMGGTLTVNSKEGVGSEFVLELQLERVEEAWGGELALRALRARVLCGAPSTERAVSQLLEELGVCTDGEPDVVLCEMDEFVAGRAPAGKPVCLLVWFSRAAEAMEIVKTGRAAGYLVLPLVEAEVSAALLGGRRNSERTDASIAETLPPLKILLVEDNPVNRKVAASMLVRLGHNVVAAEGGLIALEHCVERGERFDIVLMDMQMPDLDGIETTRRLRQWERETGAGRMPVIALTANTMASDREDCAAAGMDDFVPKPIDFKKLMDRIVAHVPMAKA